ncbi:PREDICTED: non-specific lipid-transfer protein A-like [Lupinus angustifolius]|uniref:non-specific lipid-transfer protein A-like n=1 Tax=Lupinus angustifolius TaxID=3871 RepID=UPI00092F0557|nr:PREDICTED: non-specific lipid-transfer protein A-like [Lupinus angustifolius]
MQNTLVTFLTWLTIFLLVVEPGRSFSFDDASNQLLPCLTYVIGLGGNTPSSECCNGAVALQSSTPTIDDRREACEFLKAVASTLPLIKDDKASSLFEKCNVTLAFPFSKDANCESIS